jgi:mannose-6-phosphate isomerase
LFTEGKGKVSWGLESLDVGLGDVFFVGAGIRMEFEASGGVKGLVVYCAFVDIDEAKR